ncbi:protein AKNAD1 [Bos indicus x Bos taurus]|uniref:protein AKNAD1 n=1 Tax=Bos indicus x Bos taurus TaxID=30522 RepID=UPI000F7D2429|nr:protein AKNAD1 [Bos indicus x Bos taurus]
MDKAYFLEDTTSKQQEDLPYDEGFSQVKLYHGYNLTSRYDILDVSNQMNLTEDESQEKATYRETCQEADMTMTLDKMTENAVSKTCDKENQCTIYLPISANQEDASKSNISDILLHHLCKEEFSKDQGINCETLPEISNNDSFDEAIIKNIIVWHVKNSWPTEQSSELTDLLNSKSDDENSNKPSCFLTMTEENTSDSDESVASGESNHEENSNFLSKIKSLCDKQKSCLWQTPQKQAEKESSGNKFKYGHSQVYYWFSNFSKVASKVKIPKNYTIDKPLITDPQASFSPKLRDKSAVGQDISESTSRSNYVEKQEQKWETTQPSQPVEMEPTVHIHQEHLTGIESEPSLSNLPSTSQEDPSLSSSYIFQKISQGKQMCQKLKEQTDQLKAKVQEFSKCIAQDSPYHFQRRRLVLEKLQGRLKLLEQEFLANKEKHLTLEEQVQEHESPAVKDFDPERKVEGEIFKLEMLLKDFKEKIYKSKCTSAVSLPVNSPINLDDLSFTSSPPLNEIIPDAEEGVAKQAAHAVRAALVESNQATCIITQTRRKSRQGGIFLSVSPRLLQHRNPAPSSPNSRSSQKEEPRRPAMEEPSTASGRQDRAETTSASCAFCLRVLQWKQKMEKKDHRGIDCGRFPIAIQDKMLHPDSVLGSDTGYSCCSASRIGLQSSKCENCGTKILNSQRVCRKEPPKEFHYRYNTPGQNFFNHTERSAFAQLRYLNENNSSPTHSKPKWICFQKANPKSSNDGCEPISRKSDLATLSPHSHSCRISENTSSSNFSSNKETESEILNSSLDHALRTATILKQTTDQMIRTIAEDLAKVQRWRKKLKY